MGYNEIDYMRKHGGSNKTDAQRTLEVMGVKFDDEGRRIKDLYTQDGKHFGAVSYDAYKAIEGNTLDSYKAKNDAEKNIIAEFRKHPGITLKSQDGTEFGKISYDAYRAITNNTIEGYTPHSETEKKAISDFKVYAENKAKEERINSNPTFARYGIDPADFDYDDLIKWASEHNHTMRVDGSMRTYFTPNYKGGFLGIGGKKLSTDQEDADMEVLYQLADNNTRYQFSQQDLGAFMSGIVGFGDGMSFGAISSLSDWSAKKKYEDAGLDSETFVSPSQAWANTVNEHKISNIVGDIGGSLVSLGVVSKAVSGATKGIKWLSSAPKWVQSAVNSGITFSAIGATETAFDGGNATDILRSAGINLVGGAVGGSLSSVVGSIGEKFLFNKGLQHKVIPEIIRNGLTSMTYAGGNTAATYFLYPDEYKPTTEEMARDLATAFAFGSISSAINIAKTSAQNKKYLDSLNNKMAADYENMARANISNKSDIAGIRKFAKNVIGYSNAMEAYLTGKEYSATINGETYTFTPNKVRLVGQDKYVQSMLTDLQTIRNNANAVLNGVGTPTTDLATTTGATSGATPTASVPPVSSASSSVPATKEAVAPVNVAEAPQSVPPVVSTPVVAETTPTIQNTNDFTDELSEVASAGAVEKYAPESASADVVSLENKLINVGASDVDRQKVVEAAIAVESTLVGTDKSLKDVLADTTNITRSAVTAFKQSVGVPKNYWSLFNTNLKTIAALQPKENFIVDYANTFAETLQSTDSVMSRAVVDSGIDVASAVSQYALTGNVPEEVKNETVLSRLSKAFTAITEPVLSQIDTTHIAIYGDARTQELTTPSGKKETLTRPNKTADRLAVDDGFSKVETTATTISEKENVADNTAVASPAEMSSVKVGDVYENKELGVTYTIVSKDDKETTYTTKYSNGYTFTSTSDNDTADILFEFDASLQKVKDGQPKTTKKATAEKTSVTEDVKTEPSPATNESVLVDEAVASADIDLAEGEILSLKHTRSVYSLFKGAERVIVGKDIITDGFVAIPLTEKNLEGVKKVADNVMQKAPNPSLSLEKLYNKNNNVVIQGNPKITEVRANGKKTPAYVFKIDDKFYACQQKFIDVFNNGKNIITANEKIEVPWTVHNESGDFVALFLGLRNVQSMNDQLFGSLKSASEVLETEKQKKADKAKVGLNQNEMRLFKKANNLRYGEIDGQQFITNSYVLVATDETETDAAIKEFESYNTYKAVKTDLGPIASKFTSLPEFGIVSEAKPISIDKQYVACVVNDIGFAFNKDYVNLLKKRSKTLKILSDGTNTGTVLVSYGENGNFVGLVLPIKNERKTVDGLKMFTGNGLPNAEKIVSEETTSAKAEVIEETKPEVLQNQPGSDTIEENETSITKTPKEAHASKEKEDFKVGDVLEFDGEQWKCVNIDSMMIDFENVNKDAFQSNMSVILPYDLFKEKTDYKVIKTPDNEALNQTNNKDSDVITAKNKGTKQIADYVADKLTKGEKITSLELQKIATEAFGGTMANNAFSIKDAYDAMELGVNQHILSMKEVSADKMLELLELLPTQTKRTEEMVKYQQFSTPPSIAYLANYTAKVNANDIMLEPSAGIGGIAVFAKKDGAKVYVNELDNRRLEVLKNMPFDGFFNEDAEQLDNILGNKLEPTVIVMNPPFSSSAERNMHKTKIGAKHIEQALKILAPNGRLVAIVGRGMADGEPAFRNWWKDIKSQYNVKANIGINGKNYNKYGTSFDIQMLVIDKNGPTTQTVTGHVDTLQELQEKLGGIRDERPAIDYSTNEQRTPATARKETTGKGKTSDFGNRVVSDTGSIADKGKSTDTPRNSGKSADQNIQSTDAEHRQPASAEAESSNVVADENGRVGSRQSDRLDGKENSDRVDNSDSGQSDIQTRRAEPRKRVKHKELTDSIFEQYQTQSLMVQNAQPHPAKVSESAAMSAIEPPAITYKPNIPQSIIDKGVVSDVQLEAISYAGQSHSQTLPNGTTRGFFLGDGTGIGKGRTIAGMMLDNYNQGRKKAVWVTLNSSLVNDAKRDVGALFGNSDLVTQFVGGSKADSVLNTDEAIMVISYSALSKGFDNKDSNFEKIVKWLGEDFDGLIVFDEAHKMGNATATKGTRGMKKASQTGLAGIALQDALPKAKIVYSSATGATEVENLRYAERLGLWGEGTPFVNGGEFVSKIKAGGLAAMELIARDMKAMGVYLSRNISYEDVQYDKITHKLTAPQRKIYDELAQSWQIVLQNITKALASTNQDKDGHARGRALGAFWSSQQRFFNQILTSMQVPSVISDIEKQLADGKSCVIQLVSTNEAAQNQEFERLKSEDLDLDEFDLTPKQVLMSLIENSFPVQQFEEYRDDNGNVRSRPVFDSQGSPVINREAVRQRDELLTKLGSIKVPSSPIDMIINHFGTDLVAENTGRARRVIQKDGKTIEEKIGSKKDADVDAFQNGNKRIIIFSKAGGTGKSYHADKSAKNQQQRVHYLLEAGWQADNAVQGFGRSHRSNQASAPIFKLVTTDLKGQMRFISTIAKRLDQLGAMTKGQRQAGGQGMFSASDNLENSFAADVLAGFYKDLVLNRVDGVDDGLKVLDKLGLKDKIMDEYNRIIPTAPELREVNKFLNRILSLESSEQNIVFEGYSQRLQDATEKAMQAGTLDKGLENYKADKIMLNEVQDIREDERSGAKTKYYNLTAEHKIKPIQFEVIPTTNKSFVGFYQNKNTGAVRAVYQTSSTTDQYGNVVSNYKLMGQVKNEYIPQSRFYGNWTKLENAEAERLWNEEVSKLPEYRQENLHLISGVVLPVWDKLPTENVRIYRVLTSDGEMLIGRVVSEDMIDQTLRRLGSARKKEKISTKDLIAGVKNGNTVHLDNGWKIVQRKVAGENRIEVVGPSYEHNELLTKKGVFTERIQYNTRYFVPADNNTEKIIDDILSIAPVMHVENGLNFSFSSDKAYSERKTIKRKEDTDGKQRKGSALYRELRRTIDEDTIGFTEPIFRNRKVELSAKEREAYVRKISKQQGVKYFVNRKFDNVIMSHDIIKEEAYNDDMRAIVNDLKRYGINIVHFTSGPGTVKFQASDGSVQKGLARATIVGDNEIYIQYDIQNDTPRQVLMHELVHKIYKSKVGKQMQNIVKQSVSDDELNELLSDKAYATYRKMGLKENEIFEEFVCDVFASINPYWENVKPVVLAFQNGDIDSIDNFKASEYTESIDAGGNANVLDNIGFGNEHRLSGSGELNGFKQNSNGEKLGQFKNSIKTERFNRVGEVGPTQSQEPNTPHTKSVHRSGVSAEAITSSGLTAEQATLKAQNKEDGMATEFYVKATENGIEQSELFVTENTVYYPDVAFERNDISVKNGVASFTEKRFKDLIEEFSVPNGGQLNQNYAKGYVAYISPSDFLSLTTNNEKAIIEQTQTLPAKYGSGKLDVVQLANTRQTPFLTIDFDDGTVYGHEGRHRMVMLRDAGIKKVAIVVESINPEENKYHTTKMQNVSVTGQIMNGKKTSGKVTLDEIIPLSPAYRNEVREKFVDNQADIHFKFAPIDNDIAELTPERKKEIFEQFERDRAGVDKPTQKQLWGERAEWIAHNMTRVFPQIPERGEKGTFFAEFRKMMIQWKALPQTSMFMTQDKLNQMTKDLTPDEFKTFSELVYFLDLQEEAQIQKERGYDEILLPNEITPQEVDQIVDVLNKEATSNVKKALDKRRQIWDDLKEQYVALNQYVGFDVSDRFKRKNYYHHQVIEYMNQGGKGVAKGKDIEIKAGRGWLKERQGSTKAINTDFLAVEYKAMLQMQYDVYVANMLGKIKDQYDIKPQLEKQAFNNNKSLLNEIIKNEATDKNGNILTDSKGKPDSETYRQQQWYNQRIMLGFSGLFDLAEAGMLPTLNGQYNNVIRALAAGNLNVPGLYNYVGEIASMELPETATDEELQARISARTVLKYTSQKKAWIKDVLADNYQTWETLANEMQDTHSIHQPRRGNYFYTKTTVDEDAFNKAFNDMIVGLVAGEDGIEVTTDTKKLFEQYSETIRLMGAAYEQWVIPNEIEATMNDVANPKQASLVSKASRALLSAWKGWSTSVNPLRTVKFGVRNLFGDIDAVIAGNPKVVLYSKRAVSEIYQAMKHKKYSPEFMEWVERGGYSSLIFANEMDTEMQDKIFSHLKGKEGLNIFKIPAKLFEGYYNGVEAAHNFREAILRYSAYLYFKNDIVKNNGKVKDNVASNRYIVKGLQSVEDKAYQLSKDLLGAYDEVATMGQALRRHAIPFYSFTETNLKRYYRIFENIITSDDNIPKKAGKLLLKTLMVNALTLLMVAWNKLVMKDEDEELPPSVRNIPHVTLGKFGDDVYAFRQLGSFSELLEWIGLEDYRWTEEDKTAALDKAVGMITPVVKTPIEMLTGLNFYPSITQPRAIRDKVEHLFSTLGVDDVYRVVAGKPTKGVGDIAKGSFIYTYDYKESAYYEILDIKRKYQGDTDNTIYGQTPKSNALYYMKTAIRYKDKKAALKYLDEYFENGGTAKGISQSISMLNPMYGYTGKDTIEKGQAFVNSLNDDEKDKLKIAMSYYENDLMLPDDVSNMLRQKGITDEQAKNLLTKYINSKCK